MTTHSNSRIVVYVGTHTGDPAGGIHQFTLDAASGALTPAGMTDHVGNPFFLALDATQRYLYAANAVNETQGIQGGGVSAFAIEAETGALTALNTQPAHGVTPCYVSVTRDRSCVLVANYSTGSLAVLPVQPDGSLAAATCTIQHEGASVDSRRQDGPHVHSIVLAPDDRYAFAADLGTDEVRIYSVDAASGQLTPNPAQPYVQVAPGSGPRHLVFPADAQHAYLINELSNTITVYDYQAASGMLTETQTISTLPPDYTGTSYCADIGFHPSGRFLYGTNRGHDSVAVYAIDSSTGKLDLLELVPTEGSYPWNLGVDPTGRYLLIANQKDDNVAVFAMDTDTGRLTYTGNKVEVPRAVCVEMLTL